MTHASGKQPRQSSVVVHEADPDGRAIVYARLAAAHGHDDERLDALAAALAERTRVMGVKSRLIITATGSGIRDFERRDDLALLLRHASSSWCEWIITSTYDRISRLPLVLETFLERIGALGVELVALRHGDTLERPAPVGETTAPLLRSFAAGFLFKPDRRLGQAIELSSEY